MKFITPNWSAPAHIKAYTTLRTSWGERISYSATDKNFHTSSAKESQQLKKLLQLPTEPIWLTQTHTSTAIEATPENKEKNADASFTNQSNHICVVLTADCLPLLICDKAGTQVAAIHAGWRGLANGIIEATVNALPNKQDELLVWLGPAIGPEKFEVGKDVYDAFTQKHAESASAFTPYVEGKWLADIYALAKIRLHLLGITQIYGGDYCTYTQEDMFFSYRRDKGRTGRLASLIWIATA